MIGRVAEGVGFVIGLALGVVLFPFWFVASRVTTTVVEYHATDYEHGPVVVEVRANRITGRQVRYVRERWDP